ncbi:MAG TPA: transcriptional regulator [Micromonosporaceae bacterium]
MLRIFFTSDDIARTRLASAPDPLWETALSLHMLLDRRGEDGHGAWRRAVALSLRSSALLPDLRLLLALNPPTGYFPDFLTPHAGADGLEAGLDAIMSTPAVMLRRDLARLAEDHQLPSEVADLGRGPAAEMIHLASAIRAYHDVGVAPYWPHIESVVEADRARRVRAVARLGAEGLLDSLRPTMRWKSGVLEVDYPLNREIHLDGRGLLLIPSYFCWRYPVTLVDLELPPVLVYPADRSSTVVDRPGASLQALGALLGNTRAAALAAIGDGCSTTDLARRVGVSAAAASQHATVLRNAGLVSSHREGNVVLHTVTPLGVAMLSGG